MGDSKIVARCRNVTPSYANWLAVYGSRSPKRTNEHTHSQRFRIGVDHFGTAGLDFAHGEKNRDSIARETCPAIAGFEPDSLGDHQICVSVTCMAVTLHPLCRVANPKRWEAKLVSTDLINDFCECVNRLLRDSAASGIRSLKPPIK
jgi:hypothetical protein